MRVIHCLCLAVLLGCADPMPVRAQYTPDPLRRPCAVAPKPSKSPPPPKKPPSQEEVTSKKVNINVASAEELAKLPGIGPALASRIVDHRTKRPFRRVSHIKRVRGIGKSIFGRIREHIEVRSEPKPGAPKAPSGS